MLELRSMAETHDKWNKTQGSTVSKFWVSLTTWLSCVRGEYTLSLATGLPARTITLIKAQWYDVNVCMCMEDQTSKMWHITITSNQQGFFFKLSIVGAK